MSFTTQQKVDIRRFCGYDAFGSQPVQAFGWRFTTWYGTLEFKMNNFQPEEESVIINTYLTNLYTLENAIPAVADNIDTLQAAVWHWNPNELRDRERLFDNWRRRLCHFIGIPPGPYFSGITSVGFAV